jgi:TrmH family RNA methyltransferase
MPSRIVQSQQNSRLKLLRRALAAPGRDSGGLAGIEGPNLLAEALRAGLRIPTVFLAQGSEHLTEELHFAADTEILILPRALLASSLATETPQPVAALVEPPKWTWPDLLKGRDGNSTVLIVILAALQDPGNLGTILRSAEAFAATGIVSLPGTVSAWNPKSVRASAGSVFRVPLLAASAEECFTTLRKASVQILTTSATPDTSKAKTRRGEQEVSGHDFSRAEKSTTKKRALAPEAINLTAPIALLIGNEGNGVPKEIASQADAAITIPCPGPVESLNAAVAASILLYEASRQRSEKKAGANP